MSVSIFIPVKEHSARIPNKNLKPLPGFPFGLLELKLSQLAELGSGIEVVVSTDSSRVSELVKGMGADNFFAVDRAPHLCRDDASIQDLSHHAAEVCSFDDVLWTHVTSPLVDQSIYQICIETYLKAAKDGYDSLVTGRYERKFAMTRGAPLNFGNPDFFWPRTQDLDPLFLLDSAIFLISRKTMRIERNRIGESPMFYEIPNSLSLDIDYPEDFEVLKSLLAKKNK